MMLKTIRYEDQGYEVRVAKLLTGYPNDSEIYDGDFALYVMETQRRIGIEDDGIVGPESWTKIAEAAPTVSTSKNKESNAAKAIQLLLQGAELKIDGIYGRRTKLAVAAYQAAKGLKADGICGKKTWYQLIVGENTSTKTDISGGFKQPVNYKQHDKRWGSKIYTSCGNTSQTMSNSGCGPTAMADVIATLIDPNVTPWDLAQKAMKWGDRTKNSGTAVSFFTHIQKEYGFEKMIGSTSLTTLKACLDAGGYVVCRMGAGYWTNGGHYICAWKYDDKNIYCNDPATPSSKKSERMYQNQQDFLKQRKDFWCFFPNENMKGSGTDQETVAAKETDGSGEEVSDIGTEQETSSDLSSVGRLLQQEKTTEKAIIDISKHDGIIDFDVLKDYVSLVIARCSLGSDLDIRFDEYAENMNRAGIPFGVYCYSYANSDAKAKDEAMKMIKYAAKYNPLFYVIDAEERRLTKYTIKTFAQALRDFGATKVGCYVAHHLYDNYEFESIRDIFDFIWIPRYGKNNDGTIESSTRPKYVCDLWQYTERGYLPGFKKGESVDMNAITGKGKTLQWFLERGTDG